MRINTREELNDISSKYKAALVRQRKQILVCAGTGCVAGGSLNIYRRFKEIIKEKGLEVTLELKEEPHDNTIGLKKSGCHGFCEMGPLIRIEPEGWLYIKVSIDDCEEIIEKSIIGNEVVTGLSYKDGDKLYSKQEDIPFYKKQTRVALNNCGHINAESIEEYLAEGGYSATTKALFDMTSEEIINEMSEAHLRGRGGGGFPTGKKWDQVLKQTESEKYIVCNGDEGDPGAFMDRSMMEGNPHGVIEGMIIAGIATKAHNGYIYVRAEYPLAVKRLRIAIEQAMEKGLLGDNILNSGFDFHIQINQGAGAFVCGEGSALTASIEGNRGMPRVKPPRTVEQGLFGKPTVLNNVETFCNVSPIINKGVHWYKTMGTENNYGTKAFALTGNVNNTGLIEVPMGTTLRKIIFDIGGGVKGGEFKAVQIGGPSGGCLCLRENHLDLTLDFDSLKKVGAMIGSGGLVVMNDKNCMVEMARFFMNFTQNESCGKCIPCREGTRRMLEILNDIVEGKGTLDDIDTLEELAETISDTALCGLGKSAAFPVRSTLRYFRDEYIEHVVDKKCSGGVCKSLISYEIDKEKCRGCSKCAKGCPVEAITGEIKKPYVIDKSKCIKCGNCIEGCVFKAIRVI
ncbi:MULTISPECIES: NADH-quinone oxidoreductase subunit NuoF [Clostridium]|jgi:NADH:ubiquinone oxidoreductase, NADH-binding (51 kD) subunit|uniref:NADH-quinone oxidoreductase subunit NuoF n=4 Tax=Clostridium TaxID=1485 RepID=A0AAE2RPH3_CLOBE|nr:MULTISPECIES: NADH-quinone oxidoreductase subunit NuoF [Clostridium]ABR36221.1 NADH dehydrogenase (quinone) [Clostridium beijerinckii NCIMB 8052]AIU01584.1 NADH dehydrogenase (quinone) [Clostridium beijerinckii ATCC 35702]ALB44733.1 NADH-quinone oxidoreductase subunit NuoF [Clostridium beijerinckii NRRL B-598]MBC2457462.1 NADH-quinone oxidoreductase subunit NuoF [Clostridium beijerinckii]MBC2474560.1 NADH-quinone oxidoreductase subunit NuoF [Clostridium beijerinckii]